MPARGVFQGNLSNTGSRVLEMLTSSKAITASHALEAEKLTVGTVGGNGIPVYFQNGLPVTDSSAKAVINWVTANSSSIGGSTGSEAATAAAVQGLMQASGSWNSSSAWVGANSASLLSRTSSLSITASLGAPTAVSISYSPNGGNKAINIKVPSNPGHIGAASASHNHTIAQVTGLGAVTDSVKRLESSSSTYVTTASFNTYTSSADGKYLPITGGTINGDLVISNNLTVRGTTVSIDATNLDVKDKLILVASGSTTRAAADGAGIAVPTASVGESGSARIQYENAGNRFTSSVNFAAPGFTGSLRGDVTGTASYALEADYAISASRAQEANHAISASEALHAASSTTATNASVAVSASHATTALTASYLIGGASMEVTNAKTASYVAWNNVANKPNYSASFVTGAFAAKIFNPYSGNQTINIPTQPGHVGAASASHTHSISQVTGLSAISTSVADMSSHTSSWNNVANTASAAYTAASQALATASVAKKEAESASYYKTQASQSAYVASGSMEDARFYSSQAATNATLSSTYAVQSSASAQLAAASASAAATSKTNASSSAASAATSATQAQTYRNAASASASVAHTAKTQAVASASAASQSAATAATYATAASASSGVVYQKAQEASASAAAAAGSATTAASARDAANTASGSAKTSATTATNAATAANNASASAKSAQTAANNASASAKTYATNASASASLLYKNLGSATQPIYLKTTGPELCDPYSSASVKSASYANNSTTASYALIAEAVKDGAGLVVNTASFALDHYKPTTATGSAIGTTAARTYIKAINVDKNNHVISVTTGSETVTNTDTKVTAVGNHYTPAQSTGKAASAGSVISGLGLDAKGHVVAITGSNSITSASFATNAAQLGGKAANQYASASHTHGYATPAQVTGSLSAYLPLAGGTVTGDLTVQGNAIFNGTASFINTADLVVKDRLILLASGSANTASANGAGIAVQTASATSISGAEAAAARIQYLSAGNKFTSSVRFEAPQIGATGFTGSLLGTASRAVSASRADSAASATSATSASHVPFATFVQTNGVYLTASVGNTTKTTAINSASRAVSAASADVATLAKSGSLLVASANADRPVLFTEGSGTANGNGDFLVNSNITFNPSTKILKTPNISSTTVTASTGFRGNLTGTASFATSASTAVNATTASVATMIDSASNQVIYDSTGQCFRFVFA